MGNHFPTLARTLTVQSPARQQTLLRRDRALRVAAALVPFAALLILACRLPSKSDERDALLIQIYQRESPAWQKSLAAHEKTTRRSAEQATRSGDAWAGNYYCGDGLGFNKSLTLVPSGEKPVFCYTERGCSGINDFDFGSVFVGHTSTGQRLVTLYGAVPNSLHGDEARSLFPLSRRLVPVLWGTRHYLIGEHQFLDFCNAVNAGDEAPTNSIFFSRSLWFLLRDGDEIKPLPATPPDISPAYRCYLLPAPVTATAVAVRPLSLQTDRDKSLWRVTEITLDRGAADGILPGMKFHGEHTLSCDSATVNTITGPHTCRAMMEQNLASLYPDPAPRRGGRFSTHR